MSRAEREGRRTVAAVLTGFSLVVALVVAAFSVAPAGAEIDTGPTTFWGVEGLASGSGNDSLQSNIFAMEQIGNRVYVGGRFTDVTNDGNSFPRAYIAAFDSATGIWIDTFTPTLNNAVNALQASPDGSRLFVGGSFTTANGQPANAFVALDPITGAVDASFSGTVTGTANVRGFDLVGNWLYVAGSFNGVASPVGNNQAFRVARFNWSNSNHDVNFRPEIQGGSVWGIAANPSADRVYLAGNFLTANGAATSGGFAAVRVSDGENATGVDVFPVNTTNPARQYLYDVVVTNGLVFAGGSEHQIVVMNESDLSLKRFHESGPKGDYQDLEVVGNRVYAGCHCRADAVIDSSNDVLWFGSPPAGVSDGVVDITNNNTWVTGFDATTGEVISSFSPTITALRAGVWAIHGAPDGCLWLGGDLTSAYGQPVDAMMRLCDSSTIDTERPTTPGSPQVVNTTADSVDLTWNPSTDNVGVDAYELYDSATNALVATSATNSVTVTGLSPGDVTYYVRARDAVGNLSWKSGNTTVTITAGGDTERPSVPGKPQVVATTGSSADFTWNGSTDNVAVTGYNLYDATTNAIVATSATTSVTVSGLAEGEYTYYLKAFDAAGNTSWKSGNTTFTISNGPAPDTERPSVPGKPAVVSLGADSADLTWTASTDNVAVTGYNIYDAATNNVLATSSTNAVTVTGLAEGTYDVYARAFDAAGNLSWKSGNRNFTIDNGPPADTERPSPPTGLMATAGPAGTVDLTWNPSTDNVGVTGYNVYEDAGDTIVATVPVDDTTVTGLPAGSISLYVRAFDAAGNTSWRSNTQTLNVL